MGVVLWETRFIEHPSSTLTNIHGNGEGLSSDVQLGSQCGVQKALIGPRVNEDPERFGLVFPQHNHMKRGAGKERRKVLYMAHQSTLSYQRA